MFLMGNTNFPLRRRIRCLTWWLLIVFIFGHGALSFVTNTDARYRRREQLPSQTQTQKSGTHSPSYRSQPRNTRLTRLSSRQSLLDLEYVDSSRSTLGPTGYYQKVSNHDPQSDSSTTLLNGFKGEVTRTRRRKKFEYFFGTPTSNGAHYSNEIRLGSREKSLSDQGSEGMENSEITTKATDFNTTRTYSNNQTNDGRQDYEGREANTTNEEKRSLFDIVTSLRIFNRGDKSRRISHGTGQDEIKKLTDYPENVEPEVRSRWRPWRRRNNVEEGTRREKATELSDLLNRAQIDARPNRKRYVERTLMGLINALAEEVEDLDITFTPNAKTSFWRKEFQQIRINFSRLGFKQIRMGGSDKYDRQGNAILKEVLNEEDEEFSLVQSADEAFDRIDKDKSGTLDKEEIAQALGMISELETDQESIEELAGELISLYDVNSDGVVDRAEYQLMVEDMAKLRSTEKDIPKKQKSPLTQVKDSVQTISKGISQKAAEVAAAAAASRPPTEDFDPNEREMGSIVLTSLTLDLRRLIFGAIPFLKRITPGGPLILEPLTVTVRGSFTREDVMGSFLLDAGLRLLVARAIRVRVRSFRDVVDGAYFFGRQWKMTSKTAPVVQVLGLSNIEFSGEKMIVTGRARIRTSPDAPVVTNTFKVRTKIGTGNNGHTIGLREPELAFVFECPEAWENGVSVIYQKLGMSPPKRPDPLYSFFPIYSPFKVNEQAGFDMGDDNRLRKIFIKDGKLRFEMRSILRPGRFLGSHYLAFTVPIRTFIITMDRVKEGIRVARKNKKMAAREKKLLSLAGKASSGSPGGSSSSSSSATTTPTPTTTSTSTATPIDESKRQRLWDSIRTMVSGQSPFLSINGDGGGPLSFLPLSPFQPRVPKERKSFFERFVEGYTLLEREGEAKNEQLTNEISDWFGRQGQSNEEDDEMTETKNPMKTKTNTMVDTNETNSE